jgi:DNA-binding NarL/FixJ family response regulator
MPPPRRGALPPPAEPFAVRPVVPPPAGALTERQAQVLALLASGLTSREVAASLWLADATVRTHVQNALTALDARTRVHAVALALQGGWLELVDGVDAADTQAHARV